MAPKHSFCSKSYHCLLPFFLVAMLTPRTFGLISLRESVLRFSATGPRPLGGRLLQTSCVRNLRVPCGHSLTTALSWRSSGPLLVATRLFSAHSAPETILEDEGFLKEEEIEEADDRLPKGTSEGFYIVKTYNCDDSIFDQENIRKLFGDEDVSRLSLTSTNITIPVALMLLDKDEYPSTSRARKACRKANIMIHRGPLVKDPKTGEENFESSKCVRARVGDRVFPGDVVGKQVRMGDGYFPVMNYKKPPFDLPVVYEDDHFAICNKPAGVVVYANRGGGHGIMTIRAALPFAVKPSVVGTVSTLRRPQPVHRLDKPTSGLLLVAKTKPAMVNLSEQFRDRKVKKTYTAVVNGIPPELKKNSVSSAEARSLGVDTGSTNESTTWQLIDFPLDEKHAVTVWRTLQYSRSLKGMDNYVTLVELKPKTGRYHQLRRHMAWVCDCPLIGDSEYDGGGPAMQLRGNGLFLCSNAVTLEHPFYNSLPGKEEFTKRQSEQTLSKEIWIRADGTVMVSASIELPDKFESFMTRENDRFCRLADESSESPS